MPSRATVVRCGGVAALAAGALYILGAILVILGHPSAYLFTRLHLPSVWGVPIGLLMVGFWWGCTPGRQATPATA
jgi:hypothetical protein